MKFSVLKIILLLLISTVAESRPVRHISDESQSRQNIIYTKTLKTAMVYHSALKLVISDLKQLLSEDDFMRGQAVHTIFEKYEAPLKTELIDSGFTEGRQSHTLRELIQTESELSELISLLNKRNHYVEPALFETEFDKYIMGKKVNRFGIEFDLMPVSRFYCNLTIQLLSSEPDAYATEICD